MPSTRKFILPRFSHVTRGSILPRFSHAKPVFSQRRLAAAVASSSSPRRFIHSIPASDPQPRRSTGSARIVDEPRENFIGLRRRIHAMSDWPQSRRAGRCCQRPPVDLSMSAMFGLLFGNVRLCETLVPVSFERRQTTNVLHTGAIHTRWRRSFSTNFELCPNWLQNVHSVSAVSYRTMK